MRTETIEIFTFNELSDAAKERARDWWRECESQDWHGHECIIDDAVRVAEILGIEFDTRGVQLMNGNTRQEPKIFWAISYSQGGGACFEGRYSYARGSCKKIREYAPQDKKLHSIADALRITQARSFYQLEASITQRGHYYNSGCMDVTVKDVSDSWKHAPENAKENIKDAMRDFADWIYSQLEAEYRFTMSDENVDNCIKVNGYEFTKDGSLA